MFTRRRKKYIYMSANEMDFVSLNIWRHPQGAWGPEVDTPNTPNRSDVYIYNLLASPVVIGRIKASPWELESLTRRREPVSPVTRTRWQMKRPTAQHGDVRMKRDIMVAVVFIFIITLYWKRDSAKRNSAKRNSAKRDSAKRDSAKRDSAKRDSAKRDSAKRDSAKRVSAKRDSAKRDSAKRDSAKRDSAKRDRTVLLMDDIYQSEPLKVRRQLINVKSDRNKFKWMTYTNLNPWKYGDNL